MRDCVQACAQPAAALKPLHHAVLLAVQLARQHLFVNYVKVFVTCAWFNGMGSQCCCCCTHGFCCILCLPPFVTGHVLCMQGIQCLDCRRFYEAVNTWGHEGQPLPTCGHTLLPGTSHTKKRHYASMSSDACLGQKS